jgi:hypothetical protein
MRRTIGVFMLVATGFGLGAALHGGLSAQSPQGQDILPALLAEVRGLRAVMEQMASAGPRVQLALGRLQLQEQRVNNLLRRLETTRTGLSVAQREEEKLRQTLVELEAASRTAEDANDRKQAGQEFHMVKPAHARFVADVQRLQLEESNVLQELASEQGRWTDINRQMEQLEGALTKR